MLYSLSDTEKAAIGGLRAVLVAAFSPEALYTYASAERHTITAISGLSGWQRLDLTDAAQASATGKPSLNNWQHAHQLDLSAPGLSVARRAVLDGLKAGPLVALVQDMAGQWWLLGQAFGLLLSSAGWQTRAFKGETSTPFSLGRLEPQAPRRVAQSFLNLIYNSATVFAAAPLA